MKQGLDDDVRLIDPGSPHQFSLLNVEVSGLRNRVHMSRNVDIWETVQRTYRTQWNLFVLYRFITESAIWPNILENNQRLPAGKFNLLKKAEVSIIDQCSNSGFSQNKRGGNCPQEPPRPTKKRSGLLESDYLNLKLKPGAEARRAAPLKEDVGNQMTQAGGTVDLRLPDPHWGISDCLRNPPPNLLITSIPSAPLKNPGTLHTCWRQIQKVRQETDLRTHVGKHSHFIGEKTKAQSGKTWRPQSSSEAQAEHESPAFHTVSPSYAAASSRPSPLSASTLIFILTHMYLHITHRCTKIFGGLWSQSIIHSK